MKKGHFLLLLLTVAFSAGLVTMSFHLSRTEEMPVVPVERTFDFSDINTQSEEETQLVHLNTATSEELQTLPGIGPVKAEAIITYREQNGFFLTTEELLNVSGIGEKTYETIADLITVQ